LGWDEQKDKKYFGKGSKKDKGVFFTQIKTSFWGKREKKSKEKYISNTGY